MRTMTCEPASDDLKLLWATPLLVRRFAGVEALHRGLEQAILALRADDPGQTRSAYGGWQCSGNLFDYDAPEIAALHQMLAQTVADCVAEVSGGAHTEVNLSLYARANVLETGGYHTFHIHTGCHFSGVYYIRTGSADPANPRSGVICFYEPRSGGAMIHTSYLGFGEDLDIAPEEGMLLLFPAFLGHSVHPYTGAGHRIAVTFNATLLNSLSEA